MKKRIMWVILVIVLLAVASSGWVFNTVQNRNDARVAELSELKASFVQQYGSDTTMKQLVSVEKVYAAYWNDKDNISYVSWCIGGVWVTVYSSGTPGTTTTP